MYDKDGVPLTQPQTVPFGTMLNDPDDVEKSLRRAQDAVLHLPFLEGYEAEHFLHGGYESMEEQIGFSRNVVRLEIWAPDLVDVTFIDLPGIISNANRVHSTGVPLIIRNVSISSRILSVTISHNPTA